MLACYLALALTHCFATRLRWGPDEPEHLTYISSLALKLELPAFSQDEAAQGRILSRQAQHPPLYYALAAPIYRLLAGAPEPLRLRGLRLLSVLLGFFTCLLTWRTARRLFPREQARSFLALALVAFLPMFLYLSAVVSNDPLLMLLFAAALNRLCALLLQGGGWRQHLLLGLLLGASLLTKQQAFALLPAALLAATLRRGEPLARRMGQMAVSIALALVIFAPWAARNLALRGTVFPHALREPALASLREAFPTAEQFPPALALFSRMLEKTSLHYWTQWTVVGKVLRSPDRPGRALLYHSYQVFAHGLAALAGLGLVLFLLDGARGRARLGREAVACVWVLLSAVIALFLGITHYAFFVDFRAVEAGRYLLAAVSAIALLFGAGFCHLFPAGLSRRTASACLSLLLFALALAQVILLGAYYANPAAT
jgi:4-amino-4-deoxy-L-arabinose transferase-like glycosyltransferase